MKSNKQEFELVQALTNAGMSAKKIKRITNLTTSKIGWYKRAETYEKLLEKQREVVKKAHEARKARQQSQDTSEDTVETEITVLEVLQQISFETRETHRLLNEIINLLENKE
ncbi:MAG: hypothetical protein ACOX6V_05040 [Patescibacteria group bacterium]|jgi:uncharacterized membrane protein